MDFMSGAAVFVKESNNMPEEAKEETAYVEPAYVEPAYVPCPICATGFTIHDAISSVLGRVVRNYPNDYNYDPEEWRKMVADKQYNRFERNCIDCFDQPAITETQFALLLEEEKHRNNHYTWLQNEDGLTPIDVADETINQLTNELNDGYYYLKSYEHGLMTYFVGLVTGFRDLVDADILKYCNEYGQEAFENAQHTCAVEGSMRRSALPSCDEDDCDTDYEAFHTDEGDYYH